MDTDTTERPSWLTRKFLEDTLRSRKGFENVSVISSDVHLAVGKGENYTSVLYRVGIKFKHESSDEKIKETRLIVKTLSHIELVSKFLKESQTFEKETQMFRVVVPFMNRLLEENSTEKNVQPLSAYCYKTSRPHTLILEDLTTLGCKLADRHDRLDLAHSIVAVKCLAQFHAASVSLNSKNPSCLDIFKTEHVYVEKHKQLLMGFTNSTMNALANVVGKWPGFEKYPDMLKATIPYTFDCMSGLVKPKSNSLSVLNHGDCWVNNMLFHYSPDIEEVDGVRFIDFQLSRFSSPAVDLQYFIYVSLKEEVRSQKTDFLLEVYHKELTDTLTILEEDPSQMSLEQLKNEFEEKSFYGFVASCNVLPAALAEPKDAFEMESLAEDGTADIKLMENMYGGDRFKEAFQILLPHFERKGLIK